jgi:hypothetical protein
VLAQPGGGGRAFTDTDSGVGATGGAFTDTDSGGGVNAVAVDGGVTSDSVRVNDSDDVLVS